MNRSSGEVAGHAPAVSPPPRRRPSPWPPGRRPETGPGVPHPVMRGRVRTAIQPISTGLRAGGKLEGRHSAGSSRPPSRLACRTRTIRCTGPSRRCRGCWPASPAFPGSACPQLRYAAATAQRRRPFTSARLHGAPWRSRSPSQRPGTARSSASAGRRLITTWSVTNFLPGPERGPGAPATLGRSAGTPSARAAAPRGPGCTGPGRPCARVATAEGQVALSSRRPPE